jgi:hypothetical protein
MRENFPRSSNRKASDKIPKNSRKFQTTATLSPNSYNEIQDYKTKRAKILENRAFVTKNGKQMGKSNQIKYSRDFPFTDITIQFIPKEIFLQFF